MMVYDVDGLASPHCIDETYTGMYLGTCAETQVYLFVLLIIGLTINDKYLYLYPEKLYFFYCVLILLCKGMSLVGDTLRDCFSGWKEWESTIWRELLHGLCCVSNVHFQTDVWACPEVCGDHRFNVRMT